MKRRIFKELHATCPYGIAALVGFIVTEFCSWYFHMSWEDVWGFPILGEYVFFLLAGSILFGTEFSDNTMERLLSRICSATSTPVGPSARWISTKAMSASVESTMLLASVEDVAQPTTL